MANVAGETHHLVIGNGSLSLGLIGAEGEGSGMRSLTRRVLSAFAMKTRSGEAKFSDREPPFGSYGWADWTGGRGQEMNEDAAKFYDSNNLNTLVPGQVMLGPLAKECIGDQYCRWSDVAANEAVVTTLGNATAPVYDSVWQKWTTAASGAVVSSVGFRLSKSGAPVGGLAAAIYSSTGGSLIGASTNSFDASALGSLPAWKDFTFPTLSLPASTTHYLQVWVNDFSAGNSFRVHGAGVAGMDTAGNCQRSQVSVGWANISPAMEMFYRINGWDPSVVGDVVKFGQLGATPVLYAGTVGQASGGYLMALNGVAMTRVVYTPATTGLVGAVTDMLPVNNAVLYVANGSANNMARTDGATWATESTRNNKAQLVCLFGDYLWRAYAPTAAEKANAISRSSLVTWGTDLTFGTDIVVGDKTNAISSMFVFDHKLYLVKEDYSIYVLDNPDATDVSRVPFYFGSMRETGGGVGAGTWKVYAYIPVQSGLLRFSSTMADNVGPDRLSGLPSGRTGRLAALLPGVSCLFGALDAGSGTSSVLAYNEQGWGEVVRAHLANRRVRALDWYAGGDTGQLWWGAGSTVWVTQLPAVTNNPNNYSGLATADSGTLITSWDDRGMPGVKKLYESVTLTTKNMTQVPQLDIYYQLNNAADDAAWVTLDTGIYGARIGANFNGWVTGYRIRFKLVWGAAYKDYRYGLNPTVTSLSYDMVERPKPGYAWGFQARLEDELTLLDGSDETMTAAQILTQLDDWADQAEPVNLYLPPDSEGAAAPAAKSVIVQPVEVTTVSYDGQKWTRRAAVSMIEV